MVGAGAIGYVDGAYFENDDHDLDHDGFETSDVVFIIEPGINALFNVSRSVQLELGIKHRFSSSIELVPNSINRINGFSAGLGIKVGIFNMGRNRYKKSI